MAKIALSKLRANPSNPRIIKDDKFKKLVKSLKDFPEMLDLRPIVCDEDFVVLGGNMRLKACKEAGFEEVPFLIAKGLSEEQKKEFIIKDNIGYGEWDWDTLGNDWDAEELEDWGLDVPNWEEEAEIDFDDLKSTEDRQKDFKTHKVTCPSCQETFSIQT